MHGFRVCDRLADDFNNYADGFYRKFYGRYIVLFSGEKQRTSVYPIFTGRLYDYVKADQRGEGVKKKVKAYLTVEASVVMAIVLCITGIMISLLIHVYQRCWYTQTICETAVYGSMWWEKDYDDAVKKADEKWSSLAENCYPVPEGLQGKTEKNMNSIKVYASGETAGTGPGKLKIQWECRQKIQDPVFRIRKINALSEAGEWINENGI